MHPKVQSPSTADFVRGIGLRMTSRLVPQVVSVKGDDDADFAFGAAQVSAGSFRLQYKDEITECIR